MVMVVAIGSRGSFYVRDSSAFVVMIMMMVMSSLGFFLYKLCILYFSKIFAAAAFSFFKPWPK